MSYHVTILRSALGKQVPIPIEQARDVALELGEWTFSESPPTFEVKRGSASCTLRYQDGELWAKTPEPWELEPMLALAAKLGARVRGDEYETYISPEETYNHPDDIALRREDEAMSRKMLRRDPLSPQWVRVYIIGFFGVLGVIAFLVGKWFERS